MLIKRANYYQHNLKAIQALFTADQHIKFIDKKLRALVELRISQINGCAYCVDKHAQQAREAGENQQRLDCLPVWRESHFFTKAECVALSWAESVTYIATTRAPDEIYQELQQHFSEQEIVDLTLIVSMMNMWNRIAISLQRLPELKPE
ncbi:carboxymuconolactone decarboxylase family protein [Candidatus Nitrosacidococcus tergens]|uniref:Carboxymuconolactone decarboxylase family protein n=1 Tax=Candidatus Nitrosacidococcus tergens TaxID=553981 RepID=A0A7G1Q7M9_9GAMM|nr:carboxymuconolactone decarboxylase family protein [Candidatus Nitrosacidococcus tergens]CAB1274627.1 Carboxymuconolactone decarboxylase family protein [Candidatus Nitrosacidococcus tergens]